jgi:sigma-B regulation protein RsbU (phosphoserine phosphatase)
MHSNETPEVSDQLDVAPAGDSAFRQELLDRRQHLHRVERREPRSELQALIRDVDAALERLEHGTFGVCEVCHDGVGEKHLANDPLARCCSNHPTPSEEARVRRDLALARDVQLGLLPKLGLPIDGWRYHYRYEAAREVGGDFCDVIPLPSGDETLVLVGDVSGKGIAASMLMSSLLATFRSLSRLGLSTEELLTRANDLFKESTPAAAYATLAVASLKPGGVVDFYSAGHWPPLVRHGSAVEPLSVDSGVPLGMFEGSRYVPTRITIDASDTLLFYTDGAIDAENANGEDYTPERLARSLASVEHDCDECLETLVAQVVLDVCEFQNGKPATDDLVLFAVRAT